MKPYGYIDESDYQELVAKNERDHVATLRQLRHQAGECAKCGEEKAAERQNRYLCDHCHKEEQQYQEEADEAWRLLNNSPSECDIPDFPF